MMKKVNRTIAGMIIKRYAGATGKKIFFSVPSGPPPEGAEVAVMPASWIRRSRGSRRGPYGQALESAVHRRCESADVAGQHHFLDEVSDRDGEGHVGSRALIKSARTNVLLQAGDEWACLRRSVLEGRECEIGLVVRIHDTRLHEVTEELDGRRALCGPLRSRQPDGQVEVDPAFGLGCVVGGGEGKRAHLELGIDLEDLADAPRALHIHPGLPGREGSVAVGVVLGDGVVVEVRREAEHLLARLGE